MKALYTILFLSVNCLSVMAQTPLKRFDPFMKDILHDWKVPGVAIGIVKDNKVLFAQGFGFRNAESRLPVTTQTIFPIASVTKTFTGIELCLLEEEGRIKLDQPIKQYIPDFVLANDLLTNEATVKDLLSHRLGLPGHDAVWWGSNKTREELFRVLKHLLPNKAFRDQWQYSNLSYMAAGYILERVTGMTWEEYTLKNVLEPLQMTNTNFSVKDIEDRADFSYPYTVVNNTITRKSFRSLDAMGPCGSINSSVDDMTKYLQMLTQNGNYRGVQVISENVILRALRPVISMPYADAKGRVSAYGLGFIHESFDRYLLVEHRGQIDGFTTILTLVPSEKIAVIILANTDLVQPTGIIRNRILESLLKLPFTDQTSILKEWIEQTNARQKESLTKVKTILDSDDRIKGTSPSHPLEAYIGQFTHPAYGTIKVTRDDKGLSITRDDHYSRLSHYHYDSFLTNDLFPFYRTTLQFRTYGDGLIDELVIAMEPKVEAVVFKRQ